MHLHRKRNSQAISRRRLGRRPLRLRLSSVPTLSPAQRSYIRVYIYINDGTPRSYYPVCLAQRRHAADLPQDRGQERWFLNCRARAGACCVSRVAARPSLCNVALLVVQASATRRTDRRPSPSGRRMSRACPSAFLCLSFLQVSVACTSCPSHASLRLRSDTDLTT